MDSIYTHTGIKYSGYTNLYTMFLLKSIFQMSGTGKLAYLIPSEFLNSKYGTPIKKLLICQNLLHTIINFKNDRDLFCNATTTCCILLLDKTPKNTVTFINLPSANALVHGSTANHEIVSNIVQYKDLSASEKWRIHFNCEAQIQHGHLRPISDFCIVSRGIATGSNDFFCFSRSKAEQLKIPSNQLSKCICHSADITAPKFSDESFQSLEAKDKRVYLLDVQNEVDENTKSYLLQGEKNGTSKKYLLAHRSPWYSMEKKSDAPIWVTSAGRKRIKFVRNLTNAKSLTTFHSIFIRAPYAEYTNVIFCYFLTPTAQQLIRQNRKDLGNGLEKFQPSDLSSALMVDINLISDADKQTIRQLYSQLQSYDDSVILQMDAIFSSYLTSAS